MDCSALKTCNTCKKSHPRSEFISESRPSSTTVTCRSCRERGRKATNKYNAKKQSKNPKKSPANHPPKKQTTPPTSYRDDTQESHPHKQPRKVFGVRVTCKLIAQQNYRCRGPQKSDDGYYCPNNELGISICETVPEIDHITPRWQGGTDEPYNLQLLCPSCHNIKTDIENSIRNGYKLSKGEEITYDIMTMKKEQYD